MNDNVYEYLKLDHKKVAKLFDLFETAKTDKNSFEIIKMIEKELRIHAESEQDTFYKFLESYPQIQSLIQHSEEEHRKILDKLDEIKKIKSFDTTLKKKMMELKNIVEHHVSEEENHIFKEAKKILSEEKAQILKLRMHDLKGKMMLGKYIKEKEVV